MNWLNPEVGKISGIPIVINWSMYLLLLLCFSYWKNLPIVVALFLFVLAHELGHAFEARRHGYVTNKITLFILGGLAEIQDLTKMTNDEIIKISFAGPFVNFIFALISGFAYLSIGWEILLIAAYINLFLCIGNLIPALPMDGGMILLSSMKKYEVKDATRKSVSVSMVLGILFIFGGIASSIWSISFIGVIIVLKLFTLMNIKG